MIFTGLLCKAAIKFINPLQTRILRPTKRYLTENVHDGWRIMFFGSDKFSLQHLKLLHETQRTDFLISKLEVVSSKPKFTRRRGHKRLHVSPVVEYCQSQSIPLHYWPTAIPSGFDLGVVVSFGHMIPLRVIESFPLGVLNVHPSLLPRWRGAAPIPHTLLAGDKLTGVTIMRIKPERFDVGPIILQEDIQVPEGATTQSLTDLLSIKGGGMLLRVLETLETSLKTEKPQTNNGITKAPKLQASQGLINWNMSAIEIDRLFRAVTGQIPIKASWKGNEFRLFEMVTLPENNKIVQGLTDPDAGLGSMKYHKPSESLQIRCQDCWVGFKSVGFGNKKNMTAKEFFNGFLSSRRAGKQIVLGHGTEIT